MLCETENRRHGFPERAKTGTAAARKSRRREMVLGRRACDVGKKALSKPEAM
jgi:hypothetical protein